MVIDTCAHWRKWLEESSWKPSLVTELIMRDEELQRRGRAGRTEPGIAYRLLPRQHHAILPEHPLPDVIGSAGVDRANLLIALQEGLSCLIL